jgi:hypothetical protein
VLLAYALGGRSPPTVGMDRSQQLNAEWHRLRAQSTPGRFLDVAVKGQISNMYLPIEEALDILTKWKDESVSIFVVGQNSFRWGLRNIDEGGIDWNVGLRGRVSEISASQGRISSNAAKVVFEGLSGNLSLSMDGCAFSYDQSSESPESLAQKPHTAISRLFIFSPSNEAFVVYELQEREDS